ncbi:alpha-mannosidase I MNS4 [Dendrobium catenatum]|uniref:alpha-mannosidase I MNS4 n=1 Tax=Dendrobium catenatum TaxID=906689 RepID=UPI0009F23B7F|nr:alpha-mannosidase I MNS4 [Dendrobium catenatum]
MSAKMAAAAFLLAFFASQPLLARADVVMVSEARQLREEVRDMFYHAFDGYMQHAFPRDELRPLTCQGEDTLGGYALTLIDSLDTLALLGDRERFGSAVEWIGENVRFDINKTVSVFETTIRVLGGLLSAHLIASDYSTSEGEELKFWQFGFGAIWKFRGRGGGGEGERCIKRRFCSCFVIKFLKHSFKKFANELINSVVYFTGIPFGSVNLLQGVDEHESQITSTAGGGTLTLEFGVLSRLTNNPIFEQVTKNAVRGIWARRSKINLVGAHINVFSGEWTQKDAGIGTSIDSFYEYLLKAYLLFGDDEYLFMFQEAYKAAMHYLYHDPWYVEVNMNSAVTVWPLFNSLQAFWPGLQVLYGDIAPAIRTHAAFFSVWKRYGFTPEGFNLASFSIQSGQRSYPLRPELIESTYWLFKATRDFRYLDAGRDMVASIQYGARCPCGYCHIADVESHKQDDHMESFFLAETVKYLWLLFDLAAGPDNIVENGPYKYIFNTEGHLLPATAEIALANEHCSYLGAFCRDGGERDAFTGISSSYQEANDTRITDSWMSSSSPSEAENSFTTSSFIKGFCPALTHDQKFGFSYTADKHGTHNVEPANQHQSHSAIMISEPLVMHSAAIDKSYSSQYPENPHREEIEKNSSDEKDSQLVREQIQT